MMLAAAIFIVSVVVALQFFVYFCHSRVVGAREIPARVASIAGLASRPAGPRQCRQGYFAISSLLRMIPNNIAPQRPVREWAGAISAYFAFLRLGHTLSDSLGLSSLGGPVTSEMAHAVAYLGGVADRRIERLSTALGRVAALDF
ncbi:MAG TPA: hypothetical protein VIH17_08890 [Candidatus Acidoferrales bacterium]